MQQQQNVVNGINVDELFGTIDAVKEQPAIAKLELRARNRWVGGANNRTMVNDFYVAGEEHTRDAPFILESFLEPAINATGDLKARL